MWLRFRSGPLTWLDEDQRISGMDKLAVVGGIPDDAARHVRGDFVEDLHGLHQTDDRVRIDPVTFVDIRARRWCRRPVEHTRKWRDHRVQTCVCLFLYAMRDLRPAPGS